MGTRWNLWSFTSPGRGWWRNSAIRLGPSGAYWLWKDPVSFWCRRAGAICWGGLRSWKEFVSYPQRYQTCGKQKGHPNGGLFYEVTMPFPSEQGPDKGKEKVEYKLCNWDHWSNGVYQLMVLLLAENRSWHLFPPRKITKINVVTYTFVSIRARLNSNGYISSLVSIINILLIQSFKLLFITIQGRFWAIVIKNW